MDLFQRIYKLHKLLAKRRSCISMSELMEELEYNRSSVDRLINKMRDIFNAPIINERGKGYRYDSNGQKHFELPGLWFNPSEIQALLSFRALLHNIQPGLLDEEIEPFRERIEKLLGSKITGTRELEKRVRILAISARPAAKYFSNCANTVIDRKQLEIEYHARGNDEITQRSVSPQRLIHYRGNWYLDAWCHKKKGLRSFSIDRIRKLKTLTTAANDIPETELDKHFTRAYGIFSGDIIGTAILKFTPKAARWVADEEWHPEQKSAFLPDGSYQLEIPYSNMTELGMDILKYGAEVEVIEPAALRQHIQHSLEKTLKKYSSASQNKTQA